MNWFMWLLMFIVGSLIVSFLIYPSSFNSFKSNMENIGQALVDNTPVPSTQQVSAQPTQPVKPTPTAKPTQPVQPKPEENIIYIPDIFSEGYGWSCSFIDGASELNSISSNSQKKTFCAYTCSQNGKIYVGYMCNAQDKLVCKCK